MIQSTKGKLIRQIMMGKPGKGFPVNVFDTAVRKVNMVNAALALEELRSPPGNQLEALRGNRSGQHSIRINSQWRICFIWTKAGPTDVEITDYH
ncbi:MAG: type II toxin-antitoxin system RelE/ParE family toxin [Paracoccaceae bacterium]|nr:type II toxin-antitoxin system RelE/ParE family toxin [Paracoccaceae bacterium]MDP7186918.1 type II toxin-antitoxin system RelE/ParE family toxin [Paracoccaceae bacterium]